MKLALVLAVGPKPAEKAIPIGVSPFIIGRAAECHLRPASTIVSHRHCAIRLTTDKAFVRDLGSTNGTYLNGQRAREEMELHNGDQIQVGPLLFVVQLPAESSSARLSSALGKESNGTPGPSSVESSDTAEAKVPTGETELVAPATLQEESQSRTEEPQSGKE